MYLEVCFWRRRMIHSYPTYAGVPGFTPPREERNLCVDTTARNRKKHVPNLFWGNRTENTARRVSSRQLRLFNQKGTLFDLAGTKNSSRTDRLRKKGRFEINRFQFFSTLISIKRPQSSH